jgi:hypothetical protein
VRTFNYGRVLLWHFLGLVAVYWLAILATLNEVTSNNLAYVVILFVGWVGLAVVGLLIQRRKYPALLY